MPAPKPKPQKEPEVREESNAPEVEAEAEVPPRGALKVEDMPGSAAPKVLSEGESVQDWDKPFPIRPSEYTMPDGTLVVEGTTKVGR
jgi:hypothetical protein